MNDALQDVVFRLKANQYKNEEHVRLGVVYRLLKELNWDIWNPQEVCAEFQAIRREDATRVDIALFLEPTLNRPDVFIEVKALGKLMPALDAAEIQLRDYNRDNQAAISILTDGRLWRFYLSNASGEFSRRCFEEIDLLAGDTSLGDAELTLDAFLSKQGIQSGSAVDDAKKYLKRTDVDRIMDDLLPLARRDAEESPQPPDGRRGTCHLRRQGSRRGRADRCSGRVRRRGTALCSPPREAARVASRGRALRAAAA